MIIRITNQEDNSIVDDVRNNRDGLIICSQEIFRALKKVANINTMRNYYSIIKYPSRNGEIYEWFSNNRGSISRPKFKQILPHISEENQMLEL